DDYLRAVWQQCSERQRCLSLLLVDVDHFKRYNDRHGHPAGDDLLRRLAELLAASLRRSEDLVSRYGGEEFLVVMPGAPAGRASELAAEICERVRTADLGVTVSIGVASGRADASLALASLVDA